MPSRVYISHQQPLSLSQSQYPVEAISFDPAESLQNMSTRVIKTQETRSKNVRVNSVQNTNPNRVIPSH